MGAARRARGPQRIVALRPLEKVYRALPAVAGPVAPLARIATAFAAEKIARRELDLAVAAGRKAGVTWESIGTICGVTRQAVAKRFG